MHDSPLGDHSGQQHTYKRIKQVFYWPGLKLDVKELVRNCEVCTRNKSKNILYAVLRQPLPILRQIWMEVSMDFIKGLPKSEGKDSILVVHSLNTAISLR